MIQPQTLEKMPLTQKQERDLRIYFFISRPEPIVIQDEGVLAILSYDLDGAVSKAVRLIPQNFVIKGTGYMAIKEFLNKIHLESSVVIKGAEKEIEPRKLSLESFKAGLLMATEEYIKVDEDKETLKKIIGSL